MFKETPEGQTHSYNDGCGEPAHNNMPIVVKPHKATCEVCDKETYPKRECVCPERREDGTWKESVRIGGSSLTHLPDEELSQCCGAPKEEGQGLDFRPILCSKCKKLFTPQPKKTPVECKCKLVDDDVTNEDCEVHVSPKQESNVACQIDLFSHRNKLCEHFKPDTEDSSIKEFENQFGRGSVNDIFSTNRELYTFLKDFISQLLKDKGLEK